MLLKTPIRSWRKLVIPAAAALVVLVGVAIAWRRTPSADVLWLLDVARRVADGQVLYRDILEINPPLIVWLLIPFTRAPHPLGWFLAGVIFLMLSSSVMTARAMKRPWVLVATLVVLLVVPIGWFGQREHLTIALILPWLLGVLETGDPPLPAGLMAGLGFSLKPQLLVAFVVVAAFTRRSSRGSLAPIAIVCVYVILVAALTPDYPSVVRTLGADYLAYGRADLADLLWANPCAWLALLGPTAWLGTRAHSSDRTLGDGLALATLGFLAGAVLQGKGWNYHYAPAVTVSTLQLLLVAAQPMRPLVLLVRCLAAALVLGFLHQALRPRSSTVTVARSSVSPQTYQRLVDDLGDAGHPRAVLALYRHAGHAFALTAYGGARFVSPFPMLWVLELPDWESKLPWWTQQIARAAQRDPPDLILISRDTSGGPSCAEVLSHDAAISSMLLHYRQRPDVQGYRVYVR